VLAGLTFLSELFFTALKCLTEIVFTVLKDMDRKMLKRKAPADAPSKVRMADYFGLGYIFCWLNILD
jgi:hypothetical protein